MQVRLDEIKLGKKMHWIAQRDEIGYVHLLEISNNRFIKIEKTVAGDYFLAIYEHEPELDPLDSDDLYYFQTLKEAKSFAELICKINNSKT